MFPTSEELQNKITNLEEKLSDPSLIANQREYKKVAQEHAQLTKLAALTGQYTKAKEELEESNTMLLEEKDVKIKRGLKLVKMQGFVINTDNT